MHIGVWVFGLAGLLVGCFGYVVGSLITRHAMLDIGDTRYREGFNAGKRTGWYDAADEVERISVNLTNEGYHHRAGICRSLTKHLNEFYDDLDNLEQL